MTSVNFPKGKKTGQLVQLNDPQFSNKQEFHCLPLPIKICLSNLNFLLLNWQFLKPFESFVKCHSGTTEFLFKSSQYSF